MTSSGSNATFAVANPSDSILLSLARAALKPGSNDKIAAWPTLDLSDAAQREFGDYELLEELGRGGMGVVYRARQKSLDRNVAIKFIADWFADSTNVTRFVAEARAAARLIHPNIVPVHEVGSVEGVHYFSMPLIEGRSLESLLDDGALPAEAMIQLLLKLCEAVDYAHRLGLLHLDLKPANVLIDARGEPLIADFGLARHMDERGGVDAQEVSGTPSFMAPEQILIKQYRLTRATDIYALGAILYLCLTGHSPHGEGAADDVIRRAAAGRIRAPRELDPKIPRDLDAICMKCLELQPSDRYASAAELADDLRRVRDGQPVSVRRIGFVERAQRWFQREPRFAAAVVIATLALLIGAAATTWQWKEAAAQRDAAKAERDRAAIASEIGAHLFAYSGDDDKRADDLIVWLRKRLPNDEERQADALAAFATSVDAEGRQKSEQLLSKVIEVMGTDYRRQVIKALLAGSDPNRQIYAAMLAWHDEHGLSKPETFTAALQSATNEHPEDPFVWQVAAVYCPDAERERHCLYPQAAENLVRLAPENMYNWLLLVMQSVDPQRAREALHEAAKRTQFDDYLSANFRANARAFEIAAVPAPALVARPVLILAPNERPESSIALLEAEGSIPLVQWQNLISYCGVKLGAPKVSDPQILADCLTVGERMMRSNGALLSRMIAVALVKSGAKGTPLAEEAMQVRRLYTYLDAMDEKLTPGQRMSYSSATFLADMSTLGEMAAWQRRIKFFGIPDLPPADWKPSDPTVLLSSRERYENMVALDHTAGLLVAQGKYAEAAASLLPAEANVRKHWLSTWLGARYLLTLGKARSGLTQYSPASANLLETWDLVRNFPPGSKDARDCSQALIDLYTAWDAAEKGKGYDTKASNWKQTLAELESVHDD